MRNKGRARDVSNQSSACVKRDTLTPHSGYIHSRHDQVWIPPGKKEGKILLMRTNMGSGELSMKRQLSRGKAKVVEETNMVTVS